MDIGIRELKATLSAVLKRAAAGEVITVTDRGKPIAVLGPVRANATVARGIEEGWITPATSRGGLRPTRRYKARMSSEQILAEDRGD